jgi:hypothetical protein
MGASSHLRRPPSVKLSLCRYAVTIKGLAKKMAGTLVEDLRGPVHVLLESDDDEILTFQLPITCVTANWVNGDTLDDGRHAARVS